MELMTVTVEVAYSPVIQVINYEELKLEATCLAIQTWSEGLPSCVPCNCSNRISTPDHIVDLQVCSLAYSTHSILSCSDGFVGYIIYLCNLTRGSTALDWVPIGEVHLFCERGVLLLNCAPILLVMHNIQYLLTPTSTTNKYHQCHWQFDTTEAHYAYLKICDLVDKNGSYSLSKLLSLLA